MALEEDAAERAERGERPALPAVLGDAAFQRLRTDTATLSAAVGAASDPQRLMVRHAVVS